MLSENKLPSRRQHRHHKGWKKYKRNTALLLQVNLLFNQALLLEYTHKAYQYGVKKQILDRAINASGIRDTARLLGIHKNTVISTLKKKQMTLSPSIQRLKKKP